MSVGYGKSVPGEVADPVTFMTNLISSLNLGTPIIISPSMSGKLSLPFLTAHPEKVKGYIPVAPVFTGRYSSQYPSIQVSSYSYVYILEHGLVLHHTYVALVLLS